VSKLPDFEGLAIFAKVVQTRSFVGAAQELRLSKATVSKAVSRIEKKFGTRLFNRTARSLALTEAKKSAGFTSRTPASAICDRLTPKEAAVLLQVGVSWLAMARMRGDGPPSIKVGAGGGLAAARHLR
jgi:Bacterial regulatory helix-turn-helix protein, lysR family